MIDPVLKKFGFSEARRSIKNLDYTYSTIKTPNKLVNTQRNKKYEPQICMYPGNKRSQVKNNSLNKLQAIIQYLRTYYGSICGRHTKQSYKIKFICLSDTCSQNLGCAQCFLYKHINHEKAELGTCLRDLQQLNSLMSDSYNMIISQKTIIKQQYMRQIDMQIKNMQQDFHQSMLFFKNKALKQIDDHLFTKYQQLQFLNLIQSKQPKGVEKQSQLIGELLKIDIKGIQRDLNQQLKQLSYEKLNYQPVVKLFEEMNGALGHFMAQFKKCFPKIYRINNESQSEPRYGRSSTTKQIHNPKLISQFQSRANLDLSSSQTKHKNDDF